MKTKNLWNTSLPMLMSLAGKRGWGQRSMLRAARIILQDCEPRFSVPLISRASALGQKRVTLPLIDGRTARIRTHHAVRVLGMLAQRHGVDWRAPMPGDRKGAAGATGPALPRKPGWWGKVMAFLRKWLSGARGGSGDGS